MNFSGEETGIGIIDVTTDTQGETLFRTIVPCFCAEDLDRLTLRSVFFGECKKWKAEKVCFNLNDVAPDRLAFSGVSVFRDWQLARYHSSRWRNLDKRCRSVGCEFRFCWDLLVAFFFRDDGRGLLLNDVRVFMDLVFGFARDGRVGATALPFSAPAAD